MKPINDTKLSGQSATSPALQHCTSTHKGCKLPIPLLCASAPVMNGSTALPACETPAIQPMLGVRSHAGRMRPAWFMAMGKKGPRRTPTRDTATPPPMREGTSQTTSSRLLGRE